jgi:NTE family protein
MSPAARTLPRFGIERLDKASTLSGALRSTAAWWQHLRSRRAPVNLALQGGGAHGAYTWGVLDALLADGRLDFEGLSGSSAGAMNAVVLASGWAHGGREGARAALDRFWTAIGEQIPFGLVTHGSGERIGLSLVSRLLTKWAGQFTPAQLNPLDLNPLRRLLEQQVDFERLRVDSPFKLFVGTTQASTGKLRVFREHELRVETLLASACLPRIHHPISIDGETFWDGGYSANPAVAPLFYECRSNDILLVLLSPLEHGPALDSVDDINARITELGFSTHFMREMRTFAQANEFLRIHGAGLGRLERRLCRTRFHMIDPTDVVPLQRSDTKLLAHGPFLELLRDEGRERGRQWLAAHHNDVGRRSSIDLRVRFG